MSGGSTTAPPKAQRVPAAPQKPTVWWTPRESCWAGSRPDSRASAIPSLPGYLQAPPQEFSLGASSGKWPASSNMSGSLLQVTQCPACAPLSFNSLSEGLCPHPSQDHASESLVRAVCVCPGPAQGPRAGSCNMSQFLGRHVGHFPNSCPRLWAADSVPPL